jgi:hypothetical protein
MAQYKAIVTAQVIEDDYSSPAQPLGDLKDYCVQCKFIGTTVAGTYYFYSIRWSSYLQVLCKRKLNR